MITPRVDIEEVICAAKEELREEKFRDDVECQKEWLKRPWWVRLFPWRIRLVIERR